MLCHGKNGDRGINGAGDLSKTAMTLEEKIEIIANGKGTMTPFKELLKENEIRQVAEYVGTLAK